MTVPLQVALVGTTGYSGFELARLLLRHPRIRVRLFARENGSSAPRQLAEVFPHVSGNGACAIEPFSWEKLAGTDLLFLATPHEVSRQWVPEAVARGLRVIDLSGAWRLKQPQNRAVYRFEDGPASAAALDQQAVYGLPELYREQLRQAQLVANPGCYATAVILALVPLVRAQLISAEHGIVCDAKSGVSGAGKQPTPQTHFVEVADNLSAYSAFGHRHTGEILEQLNLAAEDVFFTTHLLPIPRGILSTMYVRLSRVMTVAEVEACYRDFYRGSKWVRIFPSPQLPQIQFSLRTNFCDLGFSLGPDARRLVVVSCLDNLVKGAAGQAVQNMNLMYGWKEEEGLA